ncbi:hypothetical protein E4U43_008682 [Claviceps pusilla]|uniref:Uncharacterized protein n=1 Tax=Claviceps pusilla TaxID=123648 RepID=A0A9P7NAK3_9HYPO|nr:hypothetical protein E4U43_008682 [Claviceps pusilla]
MSAAVNNRSSREVLEDAIEELTTENVVLESMEFESWPGIELERQKADHIGNADIKQCGRAQTTSVKFHMRAAKLLYPGCITDDGTSDQSHLAELEKQKYE